MPNGMHRTVLLNETIDGLLASQKRSEGGNEKLVIVDGTFGGGGHSKEICRRLSRFPNAKIIALDQDADTKKNIPIDCKIIFHNENFRNLDQVLESEGMKEVDGIILDLGLSSDQLANSGRGFSFMKEEPLLMTMKANPSPDDVTAEDVLNTWGEGALADIIYGYGEEKQARRIAKFIVDARKQKEIKSTSQLVAIIESAIPARFRKGKGRKIHFATKTFQAIRIAVNDELGALGEGLKKGCEALKPGGRMAVISFHSLEDRVVKKFYKEREKAGKAILINKKVIKAGEEEIKNNPRSRSAKLRILEKIK